MDILWSLRAGKPALAKPSLCTIHQALPQLHSSTFGSPHLYTFTLRPQGCQRIDDAYPRTSPRQHLQESQTPSSSWNVETPQTQVAKTVFPGLTSYVLL